MDAQDAYIIRNREIVPHVLEEIANFKVVFKSQNDEFNNAIEGVTVDLNSSVGEGAKLYSEVVQDSSPEHNSMSNSLQIQVSNSSNTELSSLLSLHECIENQKEALVQVSGVLNKLESVQSLYPTSKALGNYNPLYNTEAFQNRLNCLCLWLNITKDIGNKLALMATVLYVDNIPGIDWPWLDYASPNKILQKIRDTSNSVTPNIYVDSVTPNRDHVRHNDGLSSDEDCHHNDGLSDDDDPHSHNDGLSSESDNESDKVKDGLSDNSEDESSTKPSNIPSKPPNQSAFLSKTPNNKSCKNVTFVGIEPPSADTSPVDSSANLIASSPTSTSTPKKDYLTTSRQFSNTSSVSRTSSSLSFEESQTSIYRHFVDRHLKKMGLRKLLHRLKKLLDGTLQRARQALEKPKLTKSQSVEVVVKEVYKFIFF